MWSLACPEDDAEHTGIKGFPLPKVIETLCKRNLAEERRIVDVAPEWRRDEDNRAYGLFVTTNGLLPLGVEEAGKDPPSQAATRLLQS
jgi:hypothetical protein